MAFQNKPGYGMLFKNTRKKKGDNLPDYNGSATTPDGAMFELAGWIKQGKKGPYLSLAVKTAREQSDDDSAPF
jgi:hypothetical protein